MRVFIFVNRVKEIGFRQTTALLISAFHNLGHDIYLANVNGLTCIASSTNIRLVANCLELRSGIHDQECDSKAVAAFAESCPKMSFDSVELEPDDLLFIRTNPGRDKDRSSVHATFLEHCQIARAIGMTVVNHPAKLSFYASKSAVSVLKPEYRSELVATSDIETIVDFVAEAGCDCVVKPLVGSRGKDVIRVSASSKGLKGLLRKRFGKRGVVAQHFVESNYPGDKRVVVLDGKIVEHNGHLAGIHRLPADGDFRANLHTGGTASELKLNSSERAAVEHASEVLYADGIRLAGIDIVGDKVIEFNVFSTGGLFDANKFSGVDFSTLIAKAFTAEPVAIS